MGALNKTIQQKKKMADRDKIKRALKILEMA